MNHEVVKILCVDDEKNVLRALQRLFMDEDYEILTASNGAEALELLTEQQKSVQLVISDYRMPGMDGVEFLKQVNERWPATIRIVLSGYADTASVVDAINEGQIYKFIPKPWNDEELKSTISKALEVYFLRLKNERLSDELMEAYLRLEGINANLEQEVRNRTEKLIFQNNVMQFAHQVMDALPVAVIGCDTSGLIVLANRLANRLFSPELATLVGMESGSMLPAEIRSLFAGLEEGRSLHLSLVINGNSCRILVTKLLTDQQQEGIIMVAVPESVGI